MRHRKGTLFCLSSPEIVLLGTYTNASLAGLEEQSLPTLEAILQSMKCPRPSYRSLVEGGMKKMVVAMIVGYLSSLTPDR